MFTSNSSVINSALFFVFFNVIARRDRAIYA